GADAEVSEHPKGCEVRLLGRHHSRLGLAAHQPLQILLIPALYLVLEDLKRLVSGEPEAAVVPAE
ncbi:MAG: hypothetical protein AAGH68_13010, partial [Pseudomonadota bacterium]